MSSDDKTYSPPPPPDQDWSRWELGPHWQGLRALTDAIARCETAADVKVLIRAVREDLARDGDRGREVAALLSVLTAVFSKIVIENKLAEAAIAEALGERALLFGRGVRLQ